MKPERHERPTPGHRVIERLTRNSIHHDPPGFPDQSGMLPVVDPQVPAEDRKLLRYTDPARLAHTRSTPLHRLRGSRVYAPNLPGLGEQARQEAGRDLSNAAKAAAVGTLGALALTALPHIATDVPPDLIPPGFILAVAGIGWFVATVHTLMFVVRTGARLRRPWDPADAAAHRHPGQFLLPEDFGDDGRALVAEVDRMIDNAAVHNRIPDQVPMLEDHLWRIAEGTAAHHQAQMQGADDEALAESRAALEKHVRELRAYIDRALAEAPAAAEIDAGQDTTDAARELRARIAGTEASINEFTNPRDRS